MLCHWASNFKVFDFANAALLFHELARTLITFRNASRPPSHWTLNTKLLNYLFNEGLRHFLRTLTWFLVWLLQSDNPVWKLAFIYVRRGLTFLNWCSINQIRIARLIKGLNYMLPLITVLIKRILICLLVGGHAFSQVTLVLITGLQCCFKSYLLFLNQRNLSTLSITIPARCSISALVKFR